jgi:tRNA wybutosine-synthesizing protein 3
MDSFDNSKKTTLQKLYLPDKSKKGDVDIDAIPAIDIFNKKKDYYTTSSCGGRINLFYEADSGKKFDAGWLLVKHDVANTKEILNALQNIPGQTLWFRQETPIFHVACRNNESAKRLLDLCMDLGFKRAGIIGQNERIMVEIIFNDKMDVPIASEGKLFVDEKFIDFLVKKANEKFLKNRELLKKFEKEIIKLLN